MVSVHLSEVPEEASVEAGGSESLGAGRRRWAVPGGRGRVGTWDGQHAAKE